MIVPLMLGGLASSSASSIPSVASATDAERGRTGPRNGSRRLKSRVARAAVMRESRHTCRNRSMTQLLSLPLLSEPMLMPSSPQVVHGAAADAAAASPSFSSLSLFSTDEATAADVVLDLDQDLDG